MASEHTGRRRFLQATGGIVAAGLAGCTGGDDSPEGQDGGTATTTAPTTSQQQQELVYLTDRGGMQDSVNAIISDFEDEYSQYTVDTVFTEKGIGTAEQIQRMKAAGNAPDVVFHAGANYLNYYQNDVLAPVTDIVEETGAPDPLSFGGESYFIPATVEPLMGLYRSDVYEEVPETWDGWLEAARDVSENTDMDGWTLPMGQTPNAEGQLTQHLWDNGVDIYEGPPDDVSVIIGEGDNRANAVETLEWVKEMSQYSPNGSGWGWGEGIEAMQQENVASHITVGAYDLFVIQDARPDLAENIDLMMPPTPGSGSAEKWYAFMEGHGVRTDGTSVEGGKELVRFFHTSDKLSDFLLAGVPYQFPPTQERLTDETLTSHPFHDENPRILELLDENWDALTGTSMQTADDGQPNTVGALQKSNFVMGQAVEQLILNDESPDSMVDWMVDELESLA